MRPRGSTLDGFLGAHGLGSRSGPIRQDGLMAGVLAALRLKGAACPLPKGRYLPPVPRSSGVFRAEATRVGLAT